MNHLTSFYKQSLKANQNYFFVNLILAILFFLPFILHRPMYFDDYYRSYWGVSHFTQDGRLLSDFVLWFASCFVGNTIDISPLTWILSCLLLVCSSFLWGVNVLGRLNAIKSIVCLMPFVTPPFIQVNMFRYDNLTIAVSLSAAFLAAIIYSGNFLLKFIKSSFFLVIMFFTYQLSVFCFFYFIVFIILTKFDKGFVFVVKEVFSKLIALLFAIVFYKVVCSFVSISEYTKESTEFYWVSWDFFVHRVLFKLKELTYLFSPFVFYSIIISFVVLATIVFYRSFKFILFGKNTNIFLLSFSLLIIPVILLLNIFTMCVVKRDLYEARYFLVAGTGCAICLYFLDLVTKNMPKLFRKVIVSLSILPLFYTIAASYAITNAFESQQRYADSVLVTMISAINSRDASNYDSISFVSTSLNSIEMGRFSANYKISNSIIYSGLTADPFNIGYKFQNKLPILPTNDDDKKNICEKGPVIKGVMFDMYENNKKAIFDLSKKICEKQN